jgi:3-oxoacyl-[acyl-carrier-protein] synthase II
MPQLTPLWLLKYLPNMPASHIAIYNDLRGPSNSLTLREASGHLALGEAAVTIQRGAADMMVVGATGTRVHPMKTVHALQSEQVALEEAADNASAVTDPTRWSRPFDRLRKGMVLGEGAAVLILEELEHARARGAEIHGEVIGHAARNAGLAGGVGLKQRALTLAMQRALSMARVDAAELSHIHAHGASTVAGDREEAAALREVLGAGLATIPTVAAKSHFGNLGGGAGWSNASPVCWRFVRGNSFHSSISRSPTLTARSGPLDAAIRPETSSFRRRSPRRGRPDRS